NTDHPPVRYAGQRYYPRLLRAGVRIFEYQPRFLHLKMVLVDDWVSVGSCNFDHWNLRFNLEANLEALDPELTAATRESFLADFQQSCEITLADWQRRPLFKRIRQRLWGWLDRLAVTLLDRRRWSRAVARDGRAGGCVQAGQVRTQSSGCLFAEHDHAAAGKAGRVEAEE